MRLLRVLEPVLLLVAPVVLVCCAVTGFGQTALVSVLVALVAVVPFLVQLEWEHTRARDIMPVVVLAALAVASRILLAPFPNFKPISAIVILAGALFGRRSGFMTGALAALVSNMYFGQGPWTPWQMYGLGMMGYLAGVCAARGWFRHPWAVCVYGLIVAVGYGLLLDTYSIVGFLKPTSWQGVLAAYLAGIPVNISTVVSTVVFLALIYVPWERKLQRIKRKYGITSDL
ncbi:MAG: ECF transporter S component [Coriobacteriales bacterium]|jgi:energy-coupling factor transport system substrate-specific component|nr:ECF transporter S component [Coriobacteriales bacterium]